MSVYFIFYLVIYFAIILKLNYEIIKYILKIGKIFNVFKVVSLQKLTNQISHPVVLVFQLYFLA